MSYIRALVALVLWLPGFHVHAATMPPVQMRFVDAESNQPIVGANVLFHAKAIEGTLTGHGGARVNLFLVETITDNAGEVHIAAQSFWPYPFILGSNYENPSMIVFKSGYALAILQNYERIIAKLDDVTRWQYNNQTIKMQRATTAKEVAHAIEWAATFAEETYGHLNGKEVCAWKQIPNFLITVDRFVKEWNRQRYLAQEQDLRRKEIGSPLQSLLINENYLTKKGCGSPGEFFAPYRLTVNLEPGRSMSPPSSMSPPPGSSLSRGQEQEIVLLSVTEVRNLPGALWFAGKGYATVNGGSSAYFWQSSTPPQLEIEIRSGDLSLRQCESLIRRGIEKGRALSIRGDGSFKGMEVAGAFLGAFRLDSLSKCEIADKT